MKLITKAISALEALTELPCALHACAEMAREAAEIIEKLSAIVDGDCTGCVDLEENKSGNCHDCSRRKDDMFRGKP